MTDIGTGTYTILTARDTPELSAAIDDAATNLTRLHDLRDGLRDASGTVSGVQHMIVDVMLLQPAVDRAVAALKPVIELTRTARQADPAAMSPRPVVERSESMPFGAGRIHAFTPGLP